MIRRRILGLDPGLRRTGWGVVDAAGSRLAHVAHGVVGSTAKAPLAIRLAELYDAIEAVIAAHAPDEAAVEITVMNKDAAGALKLGQARAIALLAPARAGLPVGEYLPMKVKKAVVGAGHADKDQVKHMVRVLLPGCGVESADAADALALAIAHAHYASGPAALAEAAP